MKKYFLYLIITGLLHWAGGSTVSLAQVKPDSGYLKDSFPVLVNRCRGVLSHAYMAQKLLSVTDTIPGWEGFPVALYEYTTGVDVKAGVPKKGLVYLLNPSAERLATWIMHACLQTKQSLDFKYTDKLLKWIDGQSGAQFPVKGVVYEDMYTRNYFEPYIFKDGVTVYPADTAMIAGDKFCTEKQLRYYLGLKDGQLKPQTGQYGRIASTTREQYKQYGGQEDVGDKNDRKLKWLQVVSALYKKAYRSDENELINAWAKQNL